MKSCRSLSIPEPRPVGRNLRAITTSARHFSDCGSHSRGEVAKAKPAVAIGSYPFFDPRHGPDTKVVLRARDAHKIAQAKRAVEEVLERVPWAQSS